MPGGSRGAPAGVPALPPPHLIIVVQPHPLQRHDLVRLPVLGLEHGPVGACGERNGVTADPRYLYRHRRRAPQHPCSSVRLRPCRTFADLLQLLVFLHRAAIGPSRPGPGTGPATGPRPARHTSRQPPRGPATPPGSPCPAPPRHTSRHGPAHPPHPAPWFRVRYPAPPARVPAGPSGSPRQLSPGQRHCAGALRGSLAGTVSVPAGSVPEGVRTRPVPPRPGALPPFRPTGTRRPARRGRTVR